ncbi:hypothetical protein D3C87_1406750 [compost metagenome]
MGGEHRQAHIGKDQRRYHQRQPQQRGSLRERRAVEPVHDPRRQPDQRASAEDAQRRQEQRQFQDVADGGAALAARIDIEGGNTAGQDRGNGGEVVYDLHRGRIGREFGSGDVGAEQQLVHAPRSHHQHKADPEKRSIVKQLAR